MFTKFSGRTDSRTHSLTGRSETECLRTVLTTNIANTTAESLWKQSTFKCVDGLPRTNDHVTPTAAKRSVRLVHRINHYRYLPPLLSVSVSVRIFQLQLGLPKAKCATSFPP